MDIELCTIELKKSKGLLGRVFSLDKDHKHHKLLINKLKGHQKIR